MIPKTKLQKILVPIQKQFKGLTEKQMDWAAKECLVHEAARLQSGKTTCLDCGYVWNEPHALAHIVENTCPGCGVKVTIKNTRERIFKDRAYYAVVTTFKGYQVIMKCRVRGYYTSGKPARIEHERLGEIWITPEGDHQCFGMYRGMGYNYWEQWCGAYELRHKNMIQAYSSDIYKLCPGQKLIPELKRIGIKKALNMYPANLYKALLSHPVFETLFKAKEYKLFRFFATERPGKMKMYWPSLKICLRHKYVIQDIGIWADYIDLLKMFKKDLHSPKYIMPADLHKEHNRYVVKKNIWLSRRDFQKRIAEMEKHQVMYEKEKGKFFGLEFIAGDLSVKVLENINDFMEEGAALNHCLYTNGYYQRKTSLIFSARVNGVRQETVEVVLTSLTIAQSRGSFNKHSEYHDKITALINENMSVIDKIARGKNKTTKQPAAVSDEVAA